MASRFLGRAASLPTPRKVTDDDYKDLALGGAACHCETCLQEPWGPASPDVVLLG